MILFQGSQDFNSSIQARSSQANVFCIGNFDGVHLGHQALIRKSKEIATKMGGGWGLLSFEPHPLKTLHPSRYQNPLFSREDQAEQLRVLGADFLVLEPFDLAFSQLTAKEFVSEILVKLLKAKHIVVGFNFHFGKNKEGSTQVLQELGALFGFEVDIISPVQINYESEIRTISTTLVRELLQKAEMEKVKSFLGRNFSIKGLVIKGQQRGRLLGFPTANVQSQFSEILPLGVYQSRVKIGDRIYPSISNVGRNPTFNDGSFPVNAETHLLNFVGDLYGQSIQVEFIKYIRAEKKFSSKEELVAQIQADVRMVTSLSFED